MTKLQLSWKVFLCCCNEIARQPLRMVSKRGERKREREEQTLKSEGKQKKPKKETLGGQRGNESKEWKARKVGK